MGITVREAMKIGGLTRCEVVAGKDGLDRTIDFITVMEVPDVIRWLKGNELLLTSLYPIKEDEEAISRVADQLNEVGSSALAIKTRRFVQEIPQVIKDAGDRLRLPIIEIDNEVSYLDIMTPLMEVMIRKSDPGRERLESFFQWTTELAMGGKGIAALIKAVQQMTDNMITVGSEIPAQEAFFQGRGVEPLTRMQKKELKSAKRTIRMQRMLDGQPTSCIVTPLLFNDELYGDITCWQTEREFLERDFHVLDRTMPLMAMEFLKAITKSDVDQTYKDDFLSAVLHGQVQDDSGVISKGKQFGWDLTQHYQILSIAIEESLKYQERKRSMLLKVVDLFRFGDRKAIVTLQKELIIVLYPRKDGNGKEGLLYRNDPQKEPVMRVAESIQRHLSEEFDDLKITVGIGRFYPGLKGIHQGYAEAVKVIRLGKPICGEKKIIHYEDLGVFRLLSELCDSDELESLYSETIGKLAEYDWISNSNLVQTLQEYFANNCMLAETAGKLFIHVNTMKYRFQKIEQITGCSLHDSEQRLLLHVGLKIHQVLFSDMP